jgi:hypothetical protein
MKKGTLRQEQKDEEKVIEKCCHKDLVNTCLQQTI